MSMIKSIVRAGASAVTAGPRAQGLIRRIVTHCQWLEGIGSGSDVAVSGERAVFNLLRKHVRPPLVVFDVGANQGQFLDMALVSLQGIDATIHCFEPAQATFAMLTQGRNSGGRVVFNNAAVGRAAGEAILWYDREGAGSASLTRRDLDHFGIRFDKSETVRVLALDDYAAEQGLDRIDLLKMDIEGHELDALAGADGLLRRRAIGMVLFEFGGCNMDSRTFFRDYWKLLTQSGMCLYRLTPGGYLSPIPAYNEALEQFRTTNFLAVTER
jgi:FkbM family methyltransferase